MRFNIALLGTVLCSSLVHALPQDASTEKPESTSLIDINESEFAARKYGPPLHDMETVAPAALGHARITNRCNFPVNLWSVDYDHPNPGVISIGPHASISERFRQPSNKGGVSLKISQTASLQPDNIVQFEYTIAGSQVWYDMSFVNCARGTAATPWCPGHAFGLKIRCVEGGCPEINCPAGTHCPYQAYYTPTGPDGPFEPTFQGPASRNVEYILCSSNPY